MRVVAINCKVTNRLSQRRRPRKQNFNGSSCFADSAGPSEGSQLLSIKLHKALNHLGSSSVRVCAADVGPLIVEGAGAGMWPVARVRSECSLASGAFVGPGSGSKKFTLGICAEKEVQW